MNNNKFILINVLAPEYYADCHIPGSINVPLSDLTSYAQKQDKAREIILYCAHYLCPASKKAWHILHDLGFTNLRAYEGGIREWLQLGYPTEGPCGQEYLKQPSKETPSTDAAVKTISAKELLDKLQAI
jgi:rhodanese-related sulfurtransferase